jgi:hypothetical protein
LFSPIVTAGRYDIQHDKDGIFADYRDVFFGSTPDYTAWWDCLSAGIWIRGFQRVLEVGGYTLSRP